ncbi:unnamed protein product, partial [Didymodactylos carnosus]
MEDFEHSTCRNNYCNISSQTVSVEIQKVSHIQKHDWLIYILQKLFWITTGFQSLIALDRLLHLSLRLFGPKYNPPSMNPKLMANNYPLVTVHLPMYNETAFCQSIIDCVCNLDYPKNRLYVRVLDDSTDKRTIDLVNKSVKLWRRRGIQIDIQRRILRHGFKAGSLNEAMLYTRGAEYVAIFDVDFLPEADFLLRTIPSLIANPDAAFVQTRWTFTNEKESFLTRMQEISLNYHHKCEQEARCRASFFMNFNGTAGVWRISAIEQSGGWNTDTLVEDLDLSLRAYLNGWISIYLSDVECQNELPPTFAAYLSQQHRWTTGPVQVLRKLIGQ